MYVPICIQIYKIIAITRSKCVRGICTYLAAAIIKRWPRPPYYTYRAVVRGGAGGTLAPPAFGVLEKRTEREMDSLLLSAPPDLNT